MKFTIRLNRGRDDGFSESFDFHTKLKDILRVLGYIGIGILASAGVAICCALGIAAGIGAIIAGIVGLVIWYQDTCPRYPRYDILAWSITGILTGPIFIVVWHWLWWYCQWHWWLYITT